MRINLLTKILFLVILLSVFPMAISGYISIKYISDMEKIAIEKIGDMKKTAVHDSTDALNDLGKTIITNQASSTAKLVSQYLVDHPDKKAVDLIGDEEFKKIWDQPIGQNGYFAIVEIKDQIIIAHPNQDIVGKSVMGWKDDPGMQEWWKIVKPTLSLKESGGYYRWKEADGTLSNKYMYQAITSTTTADGCYLTVTATSYVDEFNQPAKLMQEKLAAKEKSIGADIEFARKKILNTKIIFIIVIFLAVIFLSVVFARAITNPIKKLTAASKKIIDGDLETPLSGIKAKDEIGQLANTLENMRKEVKASRENLESRVNARTKELKMSGEKLKRSKEELEIKNEDLEKINKIAIDRELKMIELKKKIKELENK